MTGMLKLKTLTPVLLCFLLVPWLSAESLPESTAPSGTLIELNSLHVYAGGCVVSSELGSHGRQMVRFWSIQDGSHDGVDLAGLQVGVLQVASANMPAGKASPESTVIYLPESATFAEQAALESWVRATLGDQLGSVVDVRSTAIVYDRSALVARVHIGDNIRFETAPIETCETNSCGEEVMYEPLTPVNGFRVAENLQSRVSEPALNLRWNDHGTPSVFVGWFGERTDLENFCSTTSLVAMNR